MVKILVCSKVDSLANEEVISLHLEDAHLSKMTVQSLMDSILENCKLSTSEAYHLICYGRKLKSDKLISNYGIKSNTLLYLFKNPVPSSRNSEDEDSPSRSREKKAKFDQTDIHNMIVASKTALMSDEFRHILEKLHDTDFRENLMQCTTGLREDPITLGK